LFGVGGESAEIPLPEGRGRGPWRLSGRGTRGRCGVARSTGKTLSLSFFPGSDPPPRIRGGNLGFCVTGISGSVLSFATVVTLGEVKPRVSLANLGSWNFLSRGRAFRLHTPPPTRTGEARASQRNSVALLLLPSLTARILEGTLSRLFSFRFRSLCTLGRGDLRDPEFFFSCCGKRKSSFLFLSGKKKNFRSFSWEVNAWRAVKGTWVGHLLLWPHGKTLRVENCVNTVPSGNLCIPLPDSLLF